MQHRCKFTDAEAIAYRIFDAYRDRLRKATDDLTPGQAPERIQQLENANPSLKWRSKR